MGLPSERSVFVRMMFRSLNLLMQAYFLCYPGYLVPRHRGFDGLPKPTSRLPDHLPPSSEDAQSLPEGLLSVEVVVGDLLIDGWFAPIAVVLGKRFISRNRT